MDLGDGIDNFGLSTSSGRSSDAFQFGRATGLIQAAPCCRSHSTRSHVAGYSLMACALENRSEKEKLPGILAHLPVYRRHYRRLFRIDRSLVSGQCLKHRDSAEIRACDDRPSDSSVFKCFAPASTQLANWHPDGVDSFQRKKLASYASAGGESGHSHRSADHRSRMGPALLHGELGRAGPDSVVVADRGCGLLFLRQTTNHFR